MQQEENRKDQEIISIEEYLYKRKKIKEREEQKKFRLNAGRTLYVRKLFFFVIVMFFCKFVNKCVGIQKNRN